MSCITEARETLLDHFEKNNSFTFPDDIKNLPLIGENKEEVEASVMIALEDLESDKLLKIYKKESLKGKIKSEKSIAVLYSPLGERVLSIDLSKATCKNIVNVVQSIIPLINLDIDYNADEDGISESEIIVLLSAIQALAQRVSELQGNSKPKQNSGEDNIDIK